MSLLELPINPVELASKRAELEPSLSFDVMANDLQTLAELDSAASDLGFIDQTYFVESYRGFIVPGSFEATELVTYTSIYCLQFEAQFRCYSKVHIGRIIGGNAVRAICLTFTTALLLPSFEHTEDSELLHVPVLAVSEITTTSI